MKMGMKEITPSVYFAGVLNPNMRVFDVIMRTENGTSYNSYVVTGSEKVAVIEGSHKTFYDYFEENVAEVLGERKIDYLVLNHTEPDHSGCVAAFVEKYPDITVVVSPAANIYIKNITNMPNLKTQVVKDGDSISLGDKTLQFMNAPFLHWPDTMFTWCPEEKVLFSCDFLGCHYCEPQLYDHRVTFPNDYWYAVKYYFDCIFGPFKPYVQKGLEKIRDLDIEYVCNSHGPILTKGCYMEKVMALYDEWSKPQERENKLIPIFYCTAYGNTGQLADKAREGVLRVFPDAEVNTYNIIEHDMGELHALLNECDACLLGTMTINKDAVPPLYGLLAGAEAVNFAKRPVALFGTYGWSGEAFANVTARLQSLKANVAENPVKVTFVPTEADLAAMADYAEGFAKSIQ